MKYFIVVVLFFSACTSTETKDPVKQLDVSVSADQGSDTPTLKKDMGPSTTCSKSESCADDQYCDLTSKSCLKGCRDTSNCDQGQICDEGICRCSAESCPEGEFCDDVTCKVATNCNQISCQTDEYCDASDLKCVAKCTVDSCPVDSYCDSEAKCVVSTCSPTERTKCTESNTKIDPQSCLCFQCLADADCTETGEACNAAGKCSKCETRCTGANDPACGGSDYCVDLCCVECVSKADCGDDFCLPNGVSGELPSCTNDPDVCPPGLICKDDRCVVIKECVPTADPTTCIAPEFCNSESFCENPFGGETCGFCEEAQNGSCFCPMGNACSETMGTKLCTCPLGGTDADCPTGTTCTLGFCF